MELTENWRIVYDENNVILENFETRVKEKGKNAGETYEAVEQYFYPTIKQALKSFLNKYGFGSEDAANLIYRITRVENIINKKF